LVFYSEAGEGATLILINCTFQRCKMIIQMRDCNSVSDCFIYSGVVHLKNTNLEMDKCEFWDYLTYENGGFFFFYKIYYYHYAKVHFIWGGMEEML
jgi:hypothetical protein